MPSRGARLAILCLMAACNGSTGGTETGVTGGGAAGTGAGGGSSGSPNGGSANGGSANGGSPSGGGSCGNQQCGGFGFCCDDAGQSYPPLCFCGPCPTGTTHSVSDCLTHACSNGGGCGPDEYCTACSGTGQCKPRPKSCPKECQPTCGCDSKPYCNECFVNQLGLAVGHPASCVSNGGGPAWDAGQPGQPCQLSAACQKGLLCCYTCPEAGPCQGECSETDAGCP